MLALKKIKNQPVCGSLDWSFGK